MKKYNYKWSNIGNEQALEFLDKSLKNNQLANFYIFSGPSDLGKFSLAKNFAQNIFLQDRPELAKINNFLELNGDFFVLEREDGKKNISIDQVRDLIKKMQSTSFFNSYKIAIIKDAEHLNENSANALLKTLEEGVKKNIIILTVSEIDLLPKTILSRGQLVNFYPVKENLIYDYLVKNYSLTPSMAKNISRLSASRPLLAIRLWQDQDLYQSYQELAQVFLEFLSANFPERIKIIENITKRSEELAPAELLAIWQSVLRDLILINNGHYDLAQNEFMSTELKDFAQKKYPDEVLATWAEQIDLALERHQANINFKSILEYLAVNI